MTPGQSAERHRSERFRTHETIMHDPLRPSSVAAPRAGPPLWALGLTVLVLAIPSRLGAQSPRLADSVYTVQLVESDTLYIGQPGGLVAPRSGDFYVGDRFASRVIRYAADGHPVSVLGRKGYGPGEFIAPQPLLVRDTLLFVADNQQLRLQVIHAQSGAPKSNHLYSGVLYSAASTEMETWLALNDRPNRTSVARFDPGERLSGNLVAWPDVYARSVRLAAIYDAVYLDAWSDSLVVAYQGTDDLLFVAGDEEVGRVTVPARRRRGAAPGLASRLDTGPVAAAFSRLSAVFGVKRLTGGEVAVVHFDQTLMDDGFVNVVVDVFLSIVSADRTVVCSDHLVTSTRYTQPAIAFRGDSLFVLTQKVDDAAATTSLTAYRVLGDSCQGGSG